MKKKSIPSLFIILILTISYSCEKEVLIDVKKAEPRLVMRAEITNKPEWVAGGPGIILPTIIPGRLTMGMSSSVYGSPIDNLTDCKVVLRKNNTLFDTIFYDQTKEYYNLFKNEQDYPVAGDSLEINVFYGNQSVSSRSKMPNKVDIKSIDTNSIFSLFIKDVRFYGSSSLTFDDPIDEDNYYELLVGDAGLTKGKVNMKRIGSDEAFITGESHYSTEFNYASSPSNYESLLFTDKTFNGEEKTVNFYFEMGSYMHQNTVIFGNQIINYYLRNVSKEYYLFKTSKRNYLISSNVNFLFGTGEPQNVSTNVKNGLGLFGLYNHDQKNYFFPKRTIHL